MCVPDLHTHSKADITHIIHAGFPCFHFVMWGMEEEAVGRKRKVQSLSFASLLAANKFCVYPDIRLSRCLVGFDTICFAAMSLHF